MKIMTGWSFGCRTGLGERRVTGGRAGGVKNFGNGSGDNVGSDSRNNLGNLGCMGWA